MSKQKQSRQLRRDNAIATVIGIPSVKGWRKQLINLQLTEEKSTAVNSIVNKRNRDARTRRLDEIFLKANCPFTLHPEFEIAGELFLSLRQAGLDAKLEVSVPSEFHVSGFMRIDIGVFHQGQLVHVIECKRCGRRMGNETSQAKAYRALNERYGLQAHFANHIKHLDRIVETCKLSPSRADAEGGTLHSIAPVMI